MYVSIQKFLEDKIKKLTTEFVGMSLGNDIHIELEKYSDDQCSTIYISIIREWLNDDWILYAVKEVESWFKDYPSISVGFEHCGCGDYEIEVSQSKDKLINELYDATFKDKLEHSATLYTCDGIKITLKTEKISD